MIFFGGNGSLSSSCLGGGAAGETHPPKPCQLGQSTCLFCGAGGVMPSCSVCRFRSGGCGGAGSEPGQVPGSADNYGGGGTGLFGGGGGGGGGFTRNLIQVTPRELIPVTVGKAGAPSAKPAGDGVVVVGWGDRLERLVDAKKVSEFTCKPFTYSLADDEVVEKFKQKCLS